MVFGLVKSVLGLGKKKTNVNTTVTSTPEINIDFTEVGEQVNEGLQKTGLLLGASVLALGIMLMRPGK